MDEADLARQLRSEADRIAENAHVADAGRYTAIDRDEVVTVQPPGLYRPPDYLTRTTTAAAVEALAGLLDRLRQANDDHAGEPTLEVQAYLSATGAGDTLEEEFRLWFGEYLDRRAEPDRLNPRVGSHPFGLALAVCDECDRLIGPVANRPGTINSYFLNASRQYADWLICQKLVAPHLAEDGDDRYALLIRPSDLAATRLAAYLRADQRSRDRSVAAAGEHLRRVSADPTFAAAAAWTDEELRGRLAALASDIQQTRGFLGGGVRPEHATVRVTDTLWAGWSYLVWGSGVVGAVRLADSREQVERELHTRKYEALLGVDRSGIARNYDRPWERVTVTPLAWTYPVLAAIRDRLLDLYCRIDFDRIRRRGRVAEAAPDEADAAVELSAVDLAGGEPGSETGTGSGLPGRPPIPALRFSRLARLLTDEFSCEVGGSKGSEVKAYRPGGRIFVFGRHKADFVVHPAQLRLALNRLAIPAGEWLRVVYGAA